MNTIAIIFPEIKVNTEIKDLSFDILELIFKYIENNVIINIISFRFSVK